jgi:hypothetical protein
MQVEFRIQRAVVIFWTHTCLPVYQLYCFRICNIIKRNTLAQIQEDAFAELGIIIEEYKQKKNKCLQLIDIDLLTYRKEARKEPELVV